VSSLVACRNILQTNLSFPIQTKHSLPTTFSTSCAFTVILYTFLCHSLWLIRSAKFGNASLHIVPSSNIDRHSSIIRGIKPYHPEGTSCFQILKQNDCAITAGGTLFKNMDFTFLAPEQLYILIASIASVRTPYQGHLITASSFANTALSVVTTFC